MELARVRERLPTAAELTGRPLVRQYYLGAWLVLVTALVFGLGSYAIKPEIGLFRWAVGSMESADYMGVNYRVYHVVAEHALSGEWFYGISPPGTAEAYRYLYPPVSVIVFYPFTVFDWTTGYLVMTLLSLFAGAVGTVLTVKYVEDLGCLLGWFDIALVFSLFTLSIHVAATVYYGNVNILLGVSFAVGFWALTNERDTLAGPAFAIPALFKLFPALVGVWLLRDRRWRATAVAIATGLAGLIAGILIFDAEVTVHYFTHVLGERGGTDAFVGGYPVDSNYYVTVQRPLSHLIWGLWPTAPYAVLPLSSVAVCTGVVGYFYRDISTEHRRLMAIFVTVVVALVIVPSFRLYAPLLFVPLVALLYSWRGPQHDRLLFVFGCLLFAVPTRPEYVVDAAAALPRPFADVLTTLGTIATVQLYAFALMLAGCAWSLRTPPEYVTSE
jgi:hypothetical protein